MTQVSDVAPGPLVKDLNQYLYQKAYSKALNELKMHFSIQKMLYLQQV
jgi:hypothetical protein